METRHLKLDYDEALAAKKAVLSSELNLLYIIRSLKSYKLLRKREYTNKNKLKKAVTSFKTRIDLILSNMPRKIPKVKVKQEAKQKIKQETKPKKISKKTKKEGRRTIEGELEEIQRKLASLS